MSNENINEINQDEINNENEDIDLLELEKLLFSDKINNTDKVNYSIYVSNTELNNGFLTLEQLKKLLIILSI